MTMPAPKERDKRVVVRVPDRPVRLGTIKGQGRSGNCWTVDVDGLRTRQSLHKTFCEIIMNETEFAKTVEGLGPVSEAVSPDGLMVIDNVRDGRSGCIGSWQVEPLVYESLGPEHVGRTVIYCDHGRAEAGTLTSWKNGTVFARYSRGDTAAGADPAELFLGIRTMPL